MLTGGGGNKSEYFADVIYRCSLTNMCLLSQHPRETRAQGWDLGEQGGPIISGAPWTTVDDGWAAAAAACMRVIQNGVQGDC